MKISNPHFIYRNMFLFYSATIIGIVLVLEINFIVGIKRQIRNDNLYYQQLLCREIANEINTMKQQVNELSKQLYSSNSENELEDMLNYLKMNQDQYLKNRLNLYSKSNRNTFEGMDIFIKNMFNTDSHITSISVVSFQNNKISKYLKKGAEMYVSDLNSDFVKDIQNEMSYVKDNTITFGIGIHNPNMIVNEGSENYLNIGAILVTFDVGRIDESYNYYNRGELIVLKNSNSVLYCSDNTIDIKNTFFLNDSLIAQRELNQKLKSQTAIETANDFYIISYMDNGTAENMPTLLWITLIASGSVLFFIGELLINFHLKKLTHRLEVILNSMERVKNGDLEVQIDSSKKQDELDIIGQNFNRMCKDLKQYIEKSYLAEIAQKNAEIRALQSQVNPHFLYNTLEAIRMKAITNGDREVGKMLYGLAVIFRSQIKDSKIISVAKELYYCKKYLELFEFRYQNRFHFEMVCPENFLEKPILKFSVQPIVENYFVHGIRIEDSDNIIRVEVKREQQYMLILIDDNGKGMSDEEIDIKNRELAEKKECSNSIGIWNVHLRMIAEYGDKYGVTLEKKDSNGLCVVLKFPY